MKKIIMGFLISMAVIVTIPACGGGGGGNPTPVQPTTAVVTLSTLGTPTFPIGGVQATLNDRRPTWVRDLPSAGRPVTLVWVKRVWRCREPYCPVSTWTETSEAIRPRASLTERARREICRRVGEDGHNVAQVAAGFGVGWGTAMAAVTEYGRPLVDDVDRLYRALLGGRSSASTSR